MLPSELSVGTLVTVHKPHDTNEFPTWTSDMDRFVGREMYVIAIDLDDRVYITLSEEKEGRTCGWVFSPYWLDSVNVNEDGDALARLESW